MGISWLFGVAKLQSSLAANNPHYAAAFLQQQTHLIALNLR